MAALLAYLASLKLRVLRHRRHAAAAASSPAPESGAPRDNPQLKRPSAAISITAMAVAALPPPQNGSGGCWQESCGSTWLDFHSAPRCHCCVVAAPHPCCAVVDALPPVPGEPSPPFPDARSKRLSQPATSGPGSTQLSAAAVTILPSTALTPAFVQRLERELASTQHNKFVCLLLAGMAKEQLGNVATGDQQSLAAAGRLCFATVEAAGEIVAGAVFYPRDSSARPSAGEVGHSARPEPAGPARTGSMTRHAAYSPTAEPEGSCHTGAGANTAHGSRQLGTASAVVDVVGGPARAGSGDSAGEAAAVGSPACCSLDPHIYVELIVSKQEGCGWGSLLLEAIEAYAAQQPGCRSVKLLSVRGTQEFYSRRGYRRSNEQREMHKRLPLLPVQ